MCLCLCFFFQAEDGIRRLVRSRVLGDVYKRQSKKPHEAINRIAACAMCPQLAGLVVLADLAVRARTVLRCHARRSVAPFGRNLVGIGRPVAAEGGGRFLVGGVGSGSLPHADVPDG